MLICKLFSGKFIHEVTNIITFNCRDNYSDIQQNSTCKAGSAQKRKLHVVLARLHLQQFFISQIICLKEKQHFASSYGL